MHCELPICAEVCPTMAITQREDGIVLLDADRCMGCRYCEMACPYRAPQFNPIQKVMTKCDFCVDLIDEGKSPACVSACQMRVLHFGDIDELRDEYGFLDEIYPLPPTDLTKPAQVLTPHLDAVRGVDHGAKIGNQEEI